jgi:hypothetical protein
VSDINTTPEPAPDGAAPTIPELGYTELLGVPTQVLDELVQLRKSAHETPLPLREWRERFATATAGHSLPPATDQKALSKAARDAYVAGAVTASEAEEAPILQVMAHLRGLAGPPTDEQVRKQYVESPAFTRQLAREEKSSELRQTMLERAAEDEARLRRWLIEIDEVVREPVSGLPLDKIEDHRRTEDRDLGEVPVSLKEASAVAWLAATPEERAEAEPFGESARREADWQMWAATSAMSRIVATEFIAFAREDDSEIGRALGAAWEQGELRELMARFLEHPGRRS